MLSIFMGTLLGVHLTIQLNTRNHHAPFTPPDGDPEVHGVHVSELQRAQEPLYALEPFPESPQIIPYPQNASLQRNPWLAAVICSAFDAERRMLIRSTWMHLYRDVPFDGRFVVSNPGPQWKDMLRAENQTFGDLIVLDHLQEDDMTANTVKTVEFYKYLVDHDLRYDFVSKMDTDLFFNARGFWERYISPGLQDERTVGDRAVIGELYYSKLHDLAFPHGSIYTYTWPMVQEVVRLQARHRVISGEDMVAAVLLLKSRQTVRMINLKGTEKFDYDDGDARGDGTPWARAGTHPDATRHALWGPDALAVHQLKSEVTFRKVADAFDEGGIKAMPPPPPPAEAAWPSFRMMWFDFWHALGVSRYYLSRFDRIPEFFWTLDEEGEWICDGIWNLGASRMGY